MTLLDVSHCKLTNLTSCVQLNTRLVYVFHQFSMLVKENENWNTYGRYSKFFSKLPLSKRDNYLRRLPVCVKNLERLCIISEETVSSGLFVSFFFRLADTTPLEEEESSGSPGEVIKERIETKSRPRSRGRNTFFHEEGLRRRGWPEASSRRMKRSRREMHELYDMML